MSWPSRSFSFETSVARSPLIRCELFHSSFFNVREATYLGMLLKRSANPSGSFLPGHAAAKPSYVTRPRRSASEPNVSSCLNFPIASSQNGNDHFSGDSTTPSRDTNRVAANRDMGLVTLRDLGYRADISGFGRTLEPGSVVPRPGLTKDNLFLRVLTRGRAHVTRRMDLRPCTPFEAGHAEDPRHCGTKRHRNPASVTATRWSRYTPPPSRRRS